MVSCEGIPVPGMEVRVAGGEIEIRGRAVMHGYLGGDPVHGWFRTGDLGEFDQRGRLKQLMPLAPLLGCFYLGYDTYQRIDRRLEIYHRETAPLVDHYLATGKVVGIHGDRSVDEVYKEIQDALERVEAPA